jgi:hypothetical protein
MVHNIQKINIGATFVDDCSTALSVARAVKGDVNIIDDCRAVAGKLTELVQRSTQRHFIHKSGMIIWH